MQVKLQNYAHAGNGISLQLYPETDVEEELLRGLWMHGGLKTGHPCKAKGGTGFYVEWKQPGAGKPSNAKVSEGENER